jgi:hypothetical protein
MARRILIDTGVAAAITAAIVGGAIVISGERLPLSLIFLMLYLASLFAALQAGTRHRVYYNYYIAFRRLSRQLMAKDRVGGAEPLGGSGAGFGTADVIDVAGVPAVIDVADIPAVTGVAGQAGVEIGSDINVGCAAIGDVAVIGGTAVDGGVSEAETQGDDLPTTDGEQGAGSPDPNQELFAALRLALRHLHNPARLGAIGVLADALPGDTPWQRGKALQQQLIGAIQRLAPAADEKHGTLWQRHQILWRLYHEGHHRTAIMRELSLSERHYQRQLHEALDMIVAQWQKNGNSPVDDTTVPR